MLSIAETQRYPVDVPRLWNDTIESHRREVREATLDTVAELMSEHGLRSVTMSQIAEQTGIGRATLYKYFSDVEAILHTWHERQINLHLEHLAHVRQLAEAPAERLEAVLEAFAFISHQSRAQHDTELAAFLHRDSQVVQAERQLHDMVRELLGECVNVGEIRDDVAPGELATYCLHALAAARGMPSRSAVRKLVSVTLAGLRPQVETHG